MPIIDNQKIVLEVTSEIGGVQNDLESLKVLLNQVKLKNDELIKQQIALASAIKSTNVSMTQQDKDLFQSVLNTHKQNTEKIKELEAEVVNLRKAKTTTAPLSMFNEAMNIASSTDSSVHELKASSNRFRSTLDAVKQELKDKAKGLNILGLDKIIEDEINTVGNDTRIRQLNKKLSTFVDNSTQLDKIRPLEYTRQDFSTEKKSFLDITKQQLLDPNTNNVSKSSDLMKIYQEAFKKDRQLEAQVNNRHKDRIKVLKDMSDSLEEQVGSANFSNVESSRNNLRQNVNTLKNLDIKNFSSTDAFLDAIDSEMVFAKDSLKNAKQQVEMSYTEVERVRKRKTDELNKSIKSLQAVKGKLNSTYISLGSDDTNIKKIIDTFDLEIEDKQGIIKKLSNTSDYTEIEGVSTGVKANHSDTFIKTAQKKAKDTKSRLDTFAKLRDRRGLLLEGAYETLGASFEDIDSPEVDRSKIDFEKSIKDLEEFSIEGTNKGKVTTEYNKLVNEVNKNERIYKDSVLRSSKDLKQKIRNTEILHNAQRNTNRKYITFLENTQMLNPLPQELGGMDFDTLIQSLNTENNRMTTLDIENRGVKSESDIRTLVPLAGRGIVKENSAHIQKRRAFSIRVNEVLKNTRRELTEVNKILTQFEGIAKDDIYFTQTREYADSIRVLRAHKNMLNNRLKNSTSEKFLLSVPNLEDNYKIDTSLPSLREGIGREALFDTVGAFITPKTIDTNIETENAKKYINNFSKKLTTQEVAFDGLKRSLTEERAKDLKEIIDSFDKYLLEARQAVNEAHSSFASKIHYREVLEDFKTRGYDDNTIKKIGQQISEVQKNETDFKKDNISKTNIENKTRELRERFLKSTLDSLSPDELLGLGDEGILGHINKRGSIEQKKLLKAFDLLDEGIKDVFSGDAKNVGLVVTKVRLLEKKLIDISSILDIDEAIKPYKEAEVGSVKIRRNQIVDSIGVRDTDLGVRYTGTEAVNELKQTLATQQKTTKEFDDIIYKYQQLINAFDLNINKNLKYASQEAINSAKNQRDILNKELEEVRKQKDRFTSGDVGLVEQTRATEELKKGTAYYRQANLEFQKARGELEKQSFGSKVGRLAESQMIFIGLAGAVGALTLAVVGFLMVGVQFDNTVSMMTAVLGDSTKSIAQNRAEFEVLEAKLMHLGTVYGGVIADIDETAISLARGGIDTKDLEKATKIALQLATLTGDTFQNAGDAIIVWRETYGNTEGILGNSAKEIEHLGDILAYMANESRGTAHDIATFSSYALEASLSAGLTENAVASLYIAFRNAGQGVSTTGTNVRRFAQILGESKASINKVFIELGVNQQLLANQMRKGGKESEEAMESFIKKLNSLSKEDYGRLIRDLQVLDKHVFDSLRNNYNTISKHLKKTSEGVRDELKKSEIAVDNVQKSWEIFVNNIKNLSLDMAKDITNAFESALDGLNRLMNEYERKKLLLGEPGGDLSMVGNSALAGGAIGTALGGWKGMVAGTIVGGLAGYANYYAKNKEARSTPLGKVYDASEKNKGDLDRLSTKAVDGMVKAVEKALEIKTKQRIPFGGTYDYWKVMSGSLTQYEKALASLNLTLKDPAITTEIQRVKNLKLAMKDNIKVLQDPSKRGTIKDIARSNLYDNTLTFLKMVGYKTSERPREQIAPITVPQKNMDKYGRMTDVCRIVGSKVGGYAHNSSQRNDFRNTNPRDGNKGDCSAFTQSVYRNSVGIDIGGTTLAQMAVARQKGYILKDYKGVGKTMRESQGDVINAPEGSIIYMGSKDGSRHAMMRTTGGLADVSASGKGFKERSIEEYAKSLGGQIMLMITNPMLATSPNTRWKNPLGVTERKNTKEANIQTPEEKLAVKLNAKSEASAETLQKELNKWKIDDKKTAKENKDDISKLYSKYIKDEKSNLTFVSKDRNADAETKKRIKEYLAILDSKKTPEQKADVLKEKASDEPLEVVQKVVNRLADVLGIKEKAFTDINDERQKIIDIFSKEKVSASEELLKTQKDTLDLYKNNMERFKTTLNNNKSFDINPYYSNKKGDLEAYNTDKTASIKNLNETVKVLKSALSSEEIKVPIQQVVTTTIPAVTKVVQKEVITSQPDSISKTTALVNVNEATKSLLDSTKILHEVFDRGANMGYYSDVQNITGDVQEFKNIKKDNEKLEKFNLIDEKLKTLTKKMVENNNKELQELQEELAKLQSESIYTFTEEGKKALKYQIEVVKKNIQDIQSESDTLLNLPVSLQKYKKTESVVNKGEVDKKYVDVVVEISPEIIKNEVQTIFKTLSSTSENKKYKSRIENIESMLERYTTKTLKDTDNVNQQPQVYTQINDNIRALSYDMIADNMKEIGQLKSDLSFLMFEDIYTFTDKGVLELQEEKILLETKIKKLEADNNKLHQINPIQKFGNKVTETDLDYDYIDRLKAFSKELQSALSKERVTLFKLNGQRTQMSGTGLDDSKARNLKEKIDKAEENIDGLKKRITTYDDEIQDTFTKIETKRQDNNTKLMDMFKTEREEAFKKYSDMFDFLSLEASNINKLEALIRAKAQIKKEDRQVDIDLSTPRSVWNKPPLELNGVDTIEEQIYANSGAKYDPHIANAEGRYEASKEVGAEKGVDFTKFDSVESFDLYSDSQAGSGAFKTEADRATMLESYKVFEEAKTRIAQLEEGKRQSVQQTGIKFALDVTSDGFGRMADVAQKYYEASGKKSKTAFKAYQAMSAAKALIATYDSANKAYNVGVEIHPTVGIVYAAMAVASGLMNVALIKQQTYHTGGYVSNGSDSNLRDDEVNAKLLKGEYVLSRQDVYNIKNTQEVPQNQQSSSNNEVVILNSVDPKLFAQYLSSREGRKIVRNIVNA